MSETRTDQAEIKRHRWRFLLVIAVAVALLGGYTVIWFQGAKIMRSEIAAWVDAERAAGRTVEHGAISVRGYPGSLRAEVDAPRWADADAWSWQAETLYVITEPLNPRRLLLTPRGEQTATVDEQTYTMRADDLRVSLTEDAVAVETAALTAEAGDAALSLGAARAAWNRNDDGSAALGLSLGQLTYRRGEDAYEVVRLNAALSEDADADLALNAFEGAVRAGEDATPVRLSGQGDVRLDDEGYPAGAMTVTVANTDALGPFLIETGVIDGSQQGLVDMAVTGFADTEGGASLPLTMRGGRLRVGPFAVADLPQF